jgi:hypothetical protein
VAKNIIFKITTGSLNLTICLVKVSDATGVLSSSVENNLSDVNTLPVNREPKKKIIPFEKKYNMILIDFSW